MNGLVCCTQARCPINSGTEFATGSPSTSLEVINSRLDLVSRMLGDILLRDSIVALLRRSHDSQRLVQKFSLGRGDPEDLLALANPIIATKALVLPLQRGESTVNTPSTSLDIDCLTAMIARIQLDGPSAL